jgi:CHAT domain-containing protein
VAQARASSSDEDCRKAWETYLDVRRQAGLDAHVEQLTFDGTRARVPARGAIVQVLLDPIGSCALLLVDGEPSVRTVPLSRDAHRLLHELFDRSSGRGWIAFYQRLVEWQAARDVASLSMDAAGPLEALDRYRRVLGVAVVDAVHQGLLESGLEAGAEVVLSPPGQLAYLPLAAATLSDGSAFNEHWSVSVTPRLSALRAERSAADLYHRIGILAPASDGHRRLSDLPYAAREAIMIADRLPPGSTLRVERIGGDLTDVLRMFSDVSIVHAACHGTYDGAEADLSHLELGDKRRLTIRRLSASTASLRNLRLVMLSACESAITGRDAVPDEFVGLPVAFLQAGARAVIGTLWPVFDDVAMATMDRFYRHYLDETGRERIPPARALALAQAWVRDASLRDLLDAGYLTAEDAWDMLPAGGAATGRRVPARVRLRGVGIAAPAAVDRAPSPAPAAVQLPSAEALAYRPYHAAVDWAPFVMLGT